MHPPSRRPFATCTQTKAASSAQATQSFGRPTRPAFPKTFVLSNRPAPWLRRSIWQGRHPLEGPFQAGRPRRDRHVVFETREWLRPHLLIRSESSRSCRSLRPKWTRATDVVYRIERRIAPLHQIWPPAGRKPRASRNPQSARIPPGSSAPAPARDYTVETFPRNRSNERAEREAKQLPWPKLNSAVRPFVNQFASRTPR